MARRIAADLPVKGVEVLAPDGGYPKWWFGVVVFMGVVGGLVGASIAPRLRPFAREEHILLGVGCGRVRRVVRGDLERSGRDVGGSSSVTLAAAAKQAFDALVQRDAPDADLGRSFARFEARFQLFWVVGAVIPTALAVPVGLGAVGVVMIVVLAIISSWVGGFVQLSLSGKSGKSGISRSWRSSSPES